MGCYVNPTNESKESFLNREGKEVEKPAYGEQAQDEQFVCLVDNGLFTAAAILYNEGEVDAFTRPEDRRKRKFYLVNTEKLFEVSPLQEYL